LRQGCGACGKLRAGRLVGILKRHTNAKFAGEKNVAPVRSHVAKFVYAWFDRGPQPHSLSGGITQWKAPVGKYFVRRRTWLRDTMRSLT